MEADAAGGARRKHVPLAEASVVIVGTVRNCAATLRREFADLNRAFQGARSVRWFLVESDSTDETVAALHALREATATFQFVSLGNLEEEISGRLARLAFCRNRYLEEVTQNPAYLGTVYMVVSDLDGMNDLLTAEAVSSCWMRDDWDVCGANQAAPYYDISALRHPDWSPNDCWREYKFVRQYIPYQSVALEWSVYSRMLRLPAKSPWIAVDSAFGGLAIYRCEALQGARYAGSTSDGVEVCEHVPLHLGMRAKGAAIYINPALINTGFTGHASDAANRSMLRRRVREVRAILKRAVLARMGR